jgi:hypothetical protein
MRELGEKTSVIEARREIGGQRGKLTTVVDKSSGGVIASVPKLER